MKTFLYRALFGDLEYQVIMETRDLLGVSNGMTEFWLSETPRERRREARGGARAGHHRSRRGRWHATSIVT